MLKPRTKNNNRVRRRKSHLGVLLFVGSVVLACLFWISQARGQTSTFDTNDEGWIVITLRSLISDDYTTVGFFTPDYSPSGGNPGGFISSGDHPGGDFLFAAPGKFLGDRSAAIGTIFSYDIMHTGSVNYQTTDVFFLGNGDKLLWESSPQLIPSSSWMTVSFSLSPSSQWHFRTTNGPTPTAADFENVFGHLQSIVIRGQYEQGSAETTAIDNVILVPEPSTVHLLGLGLMLLITWRCRLRAI